MSLWHLCYHSSPYCYLPHAVGLNICSARGVGKRPGENTHKRKARGGAVALLLCAKRHARRRLLRTRWRRFALTHSYTLVQPPPPPLPAGDVSGDSGRRDAVNSRKEHYLFTLAGGRTSGYKRRRTCMNSQRLLPRATLVAAQTRVTHALRRLICRTCHAFVWRRRDKPRLTAKARARHPAAAMVARTCNGTPDSATFLHALWRASSPWPPLWRGDANIPAISGMGRNGKPGGMAGGAGRQAGEQALGDVTACHYTYCLSTIA